MNDIKKLILSVLLGTTLLLGGASSAFAECPCPCPDSGTSGVTAGDSRTGGSIDTPG